MSDITFRLSATDLAALLGGYGEIQLDEDTRAAFVKKKEQSPDDRYDEDYLTERDSEEADYPDSESTAGKQTVDPRVFGEMVHRICELRPPESQWLNLMEQTLVNEDADVALTNDLQHRVSEHAQRGIEYVDEQTSTVNVEQQYDESYVTAEFEKGKLPTYGQYPSVRATEPNSLTPLYFLWKLALHMVLTRGFG